MANWVTNRIGFVCADQKLTSEIILDYFHFEKPNNHHGGYDIGDGYFVVQVDTPWKPIDLFSEKFFDKYPNMPFVHYFWVENGEGCGIIFFNKVGKELECEFELFYWPRKVMEDMFVYGETDKIDVKWDFSLYPVDKIFTNVFQSINTDLRLIEEYHRTNTDQTIEESPNDEEEFCSEFDLKTVPVLYCGKYYDGLLAEYTDGKSVISPKQIREGCVIKDLHESNHPSIGRKILKSVSAEYLTRKNGTEYH